MILLIIFSAISALCVIGLIIFAIVRTVSNEDGKKGLWRLVFVPLGVLPMLFILFGKFCKVEANEIGIIYDDRYGIVDKTFKEGFHTKSVFEHVKKISTLNRDKFITTASQTDDGQYAEFEISITYAIEEQDAPKFFRKVGGNEMIDDQLMSLIERDLQSTTIAYNIFDLLSEGLEEARSVFEEKLQASLYHGYGITLRFATFKDVDAGEEVENILKAKATAEQQISIATKNAEAARITAENEAEIKKILADAEAYAVKVAGDASGDAASAYVNHVLGMIDNLQEETGLPYEDCASIVMSIVFYNTWDGVLPSVLTSDSLSAMIGALING